MTENTEFIRSFATICGTAPLEKARMEANRFLEVLTLEEDKKEFIKYCRLWGYKTPKEIAAEKERDTYVAPVFTTAQAAEALDLTPGHIRQLCQKGILMGATKMGRDWIIPRESVDVYKYIKR